MSNLVHSCGIDWFSRRVSGGWMLLQGKLMKVGKPVDSQNVCAYDDSSGNQILIDSSVFTGFKVFTYPDVGYRKAGNDAVVFLTKRHSVNRGIRAEQLYADFSPLSLMLYNLGHLKNVRVGEMEKIRLLFFPEYDKASDIKLVLAGEKTAAVLSADVLVEAAIDADDYTIFYRKKKVGFMTPDGTATYRTPAYEKLVAHLLEDK